jgi:hypothetical protein
VNALEIFLRQNPKSFLETFALGSEVLDNSQIRLIADALKSLIR